ncbi:hypothetical protein [Streptomyces sp. NPDC049881]|uniref:hypothetical protein n=1 Tax=unclassified Streptomyces TaxID=2593676 RepID=UPI003445E934
MHGRMTGSVDDQRQGRPVRARVGADEAEVRAAAEIRAFYGGRPAPLPDGVAAPTEEELRAADDVMW